MTAEEIAHIRQKLRRELQAWIESHTADFLMQLGGPTPVLPIVEDFRLLICITEGSDANGGDWYPVVSSGSTYHRQLGLLDQAVDYMHMDKENIE